MRRWEGTAGAGRTQVCLRLADTGQGVEILLTGGHSPHIGAVVMALPRPSLAEGGAPSCDTFVLPVPGHKDFIPAEHVAAIFSKALAVPVVVTCGIHSDSMSGEEIGLVLSNVDGLCRAGLAGMAAACPDNPPGPCAAFAR